MGALASTNLTTVNPMFASNFPTSDVNFLMFDQLVGLYPKGGAEFVPSLADYYEIAEDGRTYTFYINPNATFHDGTPVTAADLVFSGDAVKNEKTGTQYTSAFNDTIESYAAIDDQTFQAVTKEVIAQIVFFPSFFLPVLPRHIWENVPVENWKTDPGSTGAEPARVVGSGAYKFESISDAEGTATLVRNDNYYDTVSKVERLIFQTWPDSTAVVEALRAGDIDLYVSPVPPSEVESLQAEESLEVAIFDTYKFRWYGYNLDPAKTPLFQDVNVRRALIYALDRESYVDNIQLGYGEVAQGTQPVLSEAYAPDRVNNPYPFDAAQAMSLLDGAGWVVGSDGIREKEDQKLSFEVMYGAGDAALDQLVAAIQDNWKQVGVDGRPTAVDFDTVINPALTTNFNFQVVLLGFNWASPSGDQSGLFGTEMYGGGFNGMRYSNPEYDKLNDQADIALDTEQRRELLIAATNILNDDAPVCVLFFRQDLIGYNVRLTNFTPTANGLLWSLPYITIT